MSNHSFLTVDVQPYKILNLFFGSAALLFHGNVVEITNHSCKPIVFMVHCKKTNVTLQLTKTPNYYFLKKTLDYLLKFLQLNRDIAATKELMLKKQIMTLQIMSHNLINSKCFSLEVNGFLVLSQTYWHEILSYLQKTNPQTFLVILQ